MAIAQNPLTGQMSGKVGNFVTSTNGNQNIVRSKAFEPRNANTVSQQTQRASFKLIVEEYQSLGGIPDLGFTEEVPNQSRYNQFVSANLPGAIDKTGPVPVIDYSKLIVASGSMRKVVVSAASADVAGIKVSYQTNLLIPDVSATDEVVAIAKTKIGELLITRKLRGTEGIGTILIPYPNISVEEVECCYLFVLSADGKKSTNSVFVTIGN